MHNIEKGDMLAIPVLPNAVDGEQAPTTRGRSSGSTQSTARLGTPEAITADRGTDREGEDQEIFSVVGKVRQSTLNDCPVAASANRSHRPNAAGIVPNLRWVSRNTVSNILIESRNIRETRQNSVAAEDRLDEDALGVAFGLRAEQQVENERDNLGVDPESTLFHSISNEFFSHVNLRSIRASKVLDYLRTSQQIGRILKFSALFSWAFVLGAFAMEPACMEDSPDFAGRMRDKSLWMVNMMTCVHLANSLFYIVLSLLCHVLISHRPGHLFEVTRSVPASRKYLPLCCDLLTVPGLIAEVVHLSEKPAVLPTAAQWISLLQAAKIWRIILPSQIVSVSSESFFKGVVGLFFSLAMFVHMLAVLLVTIANLEHSWGKDSWIRTRFAEERSCFVLYSEVLYFAALSVTSVGYGDLLNTTLERGLNTFLLLLSQLFTAKVCADLTWLTSLHNHWEAEQQALQAQTSFALHHLHVPRTLSKRVLAFQSFLSNVHREEALDQPAFRGLSPNLSNELRLCVYRQLVLQAPFLREQPTKVIACIVNSLEDAIFLPADFIVRFGDAGRELFFIRRGETGVFATGADPPVWGQSMEVKSYSAGDYFGELSMLTSKPRSAWVMAKSYTVVSKLQHSVVEIIKDEFPKAFTTLVQSMVSSFNLQPSTAWSEVVHAWRKRIGGDNEDCYVWFCQQAHTDGNNDDSDMYDMEVHLSAKAFEIGLKKLHVKEIDRMVLWADLDADNSGYVSFEEFVAKMDFGDCEVGEGSEASSICASSPHSPTRSFTKERRRSLDSVRSTFSMNARRTSTSFYVQRQNDEDLRHLTEKVSVLYSEMQTMGKLMSGLVAGDNASSGP